ncbi:hypothetical protein RCL1_006149 [Eukaryota sp. TZLM3-RCL]
MSASPSSLVKLRDLSSPTIYLSGLDHSGCFNVFASLTCSPKYRFVHNDSCHKNKMTVDSISLNLVLCPLSLIPVTADCVVLVVDNLDILREPLLEDTVKTLFQSQILTVLLSFDSNSSSVNNSTLLSQLPCFFVKNLSSVDLHSVFVKILDLKTKFREPSSCCTIL